ASDAEVQQTGVESVITHIETHAPDVLCIDGIAQYGAKGRSVPERMMEVSQTMKRIAKKKKLIVMQTCHMNREAAKSKKGGGGLGTISWSDQIANDSDFVFELVAPGGNVKMTERMFINLKGRNSSF